MTQKRLLILSCSQRKRPAPGMMPAIERYDGPQFQVLRKYLREKTDGGEDLDIWILSAAHGLISSEQDILDYDQSITSQRVLELQKAVLSKFADLMDNAYVKICISLSKRYLKVFENWSALVPSLASVTVISGAQGVRLTQLRNWLWEKEFEIRKLKQTLIEPRGVARLRGVKLQITTAEVLERALIALAEDGHNAKNFRNWYVEINDQRIAPKWLVSSLTGLPVRDFTAGEARQVLYQLGVVVYKISE